jgi:hypothetical protein
LGIPPDEVPRHKDFANLYEQLAVYFDNTPGVKLLSGAEEADLAPKFAALAEHEALTLQGEVIPDYRGVEYHKKTSGKWEKVKIEAVGEALPDGAVLPDDLTAEQNAEIREQQEADRVAALTPEQRNREEYDKIKREITARDYRALKAYKLGQSLDDLYPGESEWYQAQLDRIHELEEALGIE